ncbi:potassium inwardly-rectifying channel, subfamily J, member 1a, tandem duplicate 1 [Silurus asotus]|uniref:Potassium inwardly-rectifying channel, subfamily J, member 1a, tandem duplicate 1 n=1 Tax=Silurus asotus TaxID=30991 RepID=A0AAD5AP55_SILAS|nr:potassium inwardly-rectifying channel, subfamily J, member 1a, tandem duplicate 1 [Silurus asotus]
MMCYLKEMFRNYLTKRRLCQKRLITKDGHCNIEYGNVRYSNCFAYVLDFWTTIVEIRWCLVFVFFVSSFALSWFIFGLLWYWIAYNNGDLAWQNPPAKHKVCLRNVDGLTTAFLFSMETQTTVGFGGRDITPYCPSAIALIIIQILLGTIINCFWCGVVMTKISLPKKRVKTIAFSEMAVVCPKGGDLCLQIRVANLRKSLMISSQIYGKLLRTTATPNGETIILDQVNVDFLVDVGKDNLFFVCPLTLYHVIDKSSPFFGISVETLNQQEFELVVFLDGIAESTSSSCQVRTSYLPQEIMWGYKFLPIISHSKDRRYRVDFSNFARVEPTVTANSSTCVNEDNYNYNCYTNSFDNYSFFVITH